MSKATGSDQQTEITQNTGDNTGREAQAENHRRVRGHGDTVNKDRRSDKEQRDSTGTHRTNHSNKTQLGRGTQVEQIRGGADNQDHDSIFKIKQGLN